MKRANGTGQQHLKFGKKGEQETVRIKNGGKAFFLDRDSAAKVSVFAKSQCSFA